MRAVEVEHLWDEIAKSCNVEILCGYVLSSFQREQESHIYERICAKHSAVSSVNRRHFGPSSQPHAWNRVQNAKAR